MDTMTSGQVAAILGTSVPRVHRGIDRLGLQVERSAGGHLRLTADQVQRLTATLGRVPEIDGLGREETLALAALGRRPFGLSSARAIARAAGISPTVASRALAYLSALGYVEHVARQVVEGRVKTVQLWQVRWTSEAWLAVAAKFGAAILPTNSVDVRPRRLPRRLAHLFWDVPQPTQIDLGKAGSSVAHRILTSNDPQALSWAANALRPSDLRRGARIRGTDNQERALAENLAR